MPQKRSKIQSMNDYITVWSDTIPRALQRHFVVFIRNSNFSSATMAYSIQSTMSFR